MQPFPLEALVKWEKGTPPNEVMVRVLCTDFRGDYTMAAMRKDFKKPKPGQSPKGFRKGWRWVNDKGEALSRKESPSGWAHI
ncbi:MAG: hypothetical protein GY941_11685 [Planctomycetes bacterium]|nr:hypothetical protein [Planctomycetota bacterium]